MNTKRERRAKLVEALRSGRFKQGFEALHQSYGDDGADEYCCLGVACVLYNELVNPGDRVPVRTTMDCTIVSYDDRDSVMPCAVQEFFGFTSGTGSADVGFGTGEQVATLVAANDTFQVSFDTIAGYIEQEPVGMFTDD